MHCYDVPSILPVTVLKLEKVNIASGRDCARNVGSHFRSIGLQDRVISFLLCSGLDGNNGRPGLSDLAQTLLSGRGGTGRLPGLLSFLLRELCVALLLGRLGLVDAGSNLRDPGFVIFGAANARLELLPVHVSTLLSDAARLQVEGDFL